MQIGHGKRRIIFYFILGGGLGLVAMFMHDVLAHYGFRYHDLFVLMLVFVVAAGAAILAARENAIFAWGSRMDAARTRINQLMMRATAEKQWTPSLADERLPTCWQQLDCDKDDCPVYGREHSRCWLIAGTFCRGEVQGQFARKLKNCRLCDVYKDATADPVREITENFYAMNYLLSEREEELEQAYEDSRARGEKLAGLVAISEAALSSMQLTDMLENLMESAVSFAGADLGYVSLVDTAGENLVVRATYALESSAAAKLTVPVGEGIVGRAYAGSNIAASEDISTNSGATSPYLISLGAKSLITLPLHGREHVLGMMTLGTLTRHHYTEEEKNSLCVVADRVASAVENSMLGSELDRDREQAELMSELTEDLDSIGGMVNVYNSFVRHAGKLLDFDRSSLVIWHQNVEELEIVAVDTRAPKTWLDRGLRLPRHAMAISKVVEDGKYLLRPEIKGDEFPADKLLVEEGMRSSVVFPLISKGESLGALSLSSFRVEGFKVEDAEMLEPLVRQLGLVLDNVRVLQEAKRLSLIDAPTGLYNHRYFYEAAVREVERSRRSKRPVSMLILDIDGLRVFRKNHSRTETDQMMRLLAARIKTAVRAIDTVARYSGDEIAVLLPEVGINYGSLEQSDAMRMTERISEVVSEGVAGLRDEFPPTISVGFAEYPSHADNADTLLEGADLALREARKSGTSVVIAASNGKRGA